MPRAEPEMVLINKFYDFAVWTGKHVAKFPRTYKFTVGDRLQNRVEDILELLIKAKYRRNRLELLQDLAGLTSTTCCRCSVPNPRRLPASLLGYSGHVGGLSTPESDPRRLPARVSG